MSLASRVQTLEETVCVFPLESHKSISSSSSYECIVEQTRLSGFVNKKLVTIVECDPKAPFSIATTPRCRGGRYSFPGLLYFTLDPYLIMLSVKQGGIKYHFLSLWYDDPGLNPGLPAIGEHSLHHYYYATIIHWIWNKIFYSLG